MFNSFYDEICAASVFVCRARTRGGGRGGVYSTNVYTERLRPMVQPLTPSYIPFFTKKVPLSYIFY